MTMNQSLETKMRYQSFENLTGKTSSNRRWNFVKLIIGFIIGHWIGQTYCHGPKCFETLESVVKSTQARHENSKNRDQNHDKIQV